MKFSLSKTPSRKIMKNTKEQSSLESELTAFLDRQFPDFVPAAKSWRMLDAIQM
jgi:hypothetical protein